MLATVTLGTAEIASKTGVSRRQLQFWDQTGLLKVRQSGHRRIYTEDDLAEACVIIDLKKKGVSLQRIRRALPTIRKGRQHRPCWVIIDNHSIRLTTVKDKAFEYLMTAEGPAYVTRYAEDPK